MSPQAQAVVDAAAMLEALRPAATSAIGAREGLAERPEDQPLLDAFQNARQDLRDACKAWLAARKPST